MKLKPVKLAPALITLGVIVAVSIVRLLQPDFSERLERMTYDMRVREAVKYEPPVVTNLGFVDINNDSISAVLNGSQTLGYSYGLLWPRKLYGRLVEELAAQKAKVVALDILFGELRPDQFPEHMADGRLVESDDFLAMQMRRASNVVLAVTKGVRIPSLFATNAMALGDITTGGASGGDLESDSDGVLRRARAFRMYRHWHWAFRQVEADKDYGIDLNDARVEPGRIILYQGGTNEIRIPLDADGNFDLADFGGEHLPPNVPRKAKPFTEDRVWHMGIVLAASELGLDLAHAEIDLDRGRIVLRGANGVERVIPVDRDGLFYIDWGITLRSPHLAQQPIQDILMQDRLRLDGKTNDLSSPWAGKLIVVGSTATGNNMADRGATPLEPNTFLAGEHWNVANSVIMGRFIHRTSLSTDLLLIAGLGIAAALLTWQLRVLLGFGLVLLLAAGYIGLAVIAYVQYRYWLPLFLPISGAMLMMEILLITWRVVFEQAEQRRVRSIFSRIVSPDIVNELLRAEKLSLGGTQREVTVLFSDVRGFTEFTDTSQETAITHAKDRNLSGDAAKIYFDKQAREILATVNTYLALVADMVKKHDGTLDKYIGDCVMAFWGAPIKNPKHALCCVRAAIDAQRAIHSLNQQRIEENKRRELENASRSRSGETPLVMMPILTLGTGINSGLTTVGLMGSEAHISNYTVFGREVNLASRLESLSGRGRILISETTFQELQRDDPALAAACAALPELQKLKGIGKAVKVYEVPWKNPEEGQGGQSLVADEAKTAAQDKSEVRNPKSEGSPKSEAPD